MDQVEALYSELQDHLSELGKQFIDTFIPTDPSVSPSEYDHLVKAYCVLSHAALEDYFESVALRVMQRAFAEWLHNRKVTEALLTLACYYGLQLKIDEDERNAETTVFDYLRPILEEAKKRFSIDINANHGVSVKYLRKLLIPVGINVKQDVNQLNSIRQLAKERGTYAHKKAAQKILSPEDAKQFVEDCLILCDDTRAKAVKKLELMEQ
jgi:hypothetical protein